MGVAKVILNGDTLIDVTQKTVASNNLLSGITALGADGEGVVGTYVAPTFSTQSKTVIPTESSQSIFPDSGYNGLSQVTVNGISSNYVGTGIPQRTSNNITQSSWKYTTNGTNDYINVPVKWASGYYSISESKTFASLLANITDLPTQGSITITPTEVSQLAVQSRRWLTGDINVGAISSTYVGTGVTKRSSTDLTASGSVVTVPSGYYATTATKNVTAGTAFTPATTITITPQLNLATTNSRAWIGTTIDTSSNITPTVTAGYISAGTSGTITVTGTSAYDLPVKTASTYTPTTINQTIESGVYLLGNQTISGDANLSAENIKKDVSIFGVTGTYEGGGGDNLEAQIINRTISGQYYNSEITTVGSYAFYYCKELTEVSFPNITSILSNAFYGCSKLSKITNLENVSYIGSYAFTNCSSLASMSTSSLSWAYSFVLSGCYNLSDISFPNVSNIQLGAFNRCSALSSAYFPSASYLSWMKANDSKYFSSSQISDYGSMYGAFCGCINLQDISFPLLKSMSPYGFGYCSGLKSVYLPSLTHMEQKAFASCINLEQISLPKFSSVAGEFQFQNCLSLVSISMPLLRSIAYGMFYSCKALSNDFVFPSVSSIGNRAFCYCDSLSEISNANFPMLSRLGTSASTSGAFGVFYSTPLTKVVLSLVQRVDGPAFQGCTTLSLVKLLSCSAIGSYAFALCSGLKTVILSNAQVGYFHNMCFYNAGSSYSTYLIGSSMWLKSETGYVPGGDIYVKESLYNTYISHSHWSVISSRIFSMTDAEIEDLLEEYPD